jgi:hypothetical protein
LNIEQRIQVLEEELNIMKNDIKPILLDIREQYLNMQNPFNDSTLMLGNKSDQADPHKPENGGSAEKNVALAPNGAQTSNGNSTPDGNSVSDKSSITSGSSESGSVPAPNAISVSNEIQLDEKSITAPGKFDNASKVSSSSDENDLPGLQPDSFDFTPHQQKEPEKRISKNAQETEKRQHQAYQFDADHKADLIMIAGLAQWIEEATFTLGKDRVEALMEMASAMGRLPIELKDVIIKLARLSKHDDAAKYPITSKDYLALLTQLENLLGHSQPNEAALLSILSMMKETISG